MVTKVLAIDIDDLFLIQIKTETAPVIPEHFHAEFYLKCVGNIVFWFIFAWRSGWGSGSVSATVSSSSSLQTVTITSHTIKCVSNNNVRYCQLINLLNMGFMDGHQVRFVN